MRPTNAPPAFHILTKPTGAICNLDCKYCFFLSKEMLYPGSRFRMADELLEEYIRQYIEDQAVPQVTVAWQGGEPTLMGVDFFCRSIEYVEKYKKSDMTIEYTIQTNGTTLDDEWGEFFREHGFLVGISVDGPQELHDAYRVDKGGQPTFDRVMRGLSFLKKHSVEFNTLTCIQRHNSQHPLEVYRFFKEIGSGFLQFIPIVERVAPNLDNDGLVLISASSSEPAEVSKWSVRPRQFGEFLCAIFDEWVRNDVGSYFVQIFDISLESWLGMDPSLCIFRETCGSAMAIEHNGDLYSCDHYVYPENRLGNIMESAMAKLAVSKQQMEFGLAKREELPRYCRECEVRFACNGECPKQRFLQTPDGEPGLNYLCAGYKLFFNHIDPYMQFMAAELRQQRPPANVMAWTRLRDLRQAGKSRPGRNEPCFCGSGKKYKKCCGAGG